MNLDSGHFTRRRKALLLLLTFALAGLAILVGAEILVRVLLRYNSPETVRENSLQYLPSIFSRHRLDPGQQIRVDEAWGLRRGEEPRGLVYRINDQGYRGVSLPPKKAAGEIRIVVLGGSAVFDPSATEGDDWPHQIQERLADLGHAESRVINAGVPGHASFDSLARFYSQVWTYQPDFVLVYNAWNDIKYFPNLDRSTPLITLFEPYDPQNDPFQHYQGFLDRLLSNSQLYVKLRTRYLIRTLRPGPEGRRPDDSGERRYGPLAIAQYRLNMELIVDAARNIGAEPILLTQATLVAPGNDARDRELINYEYQSMGHEALVRAFGECNDVIRSIAAAKDVAILDLAESLSGRRELFEDHVHTSQKGSAAIAEAVAVFLAKHLD